jgi:hypothetical protein
MTERHPKAFPLHDVATIADTEDLGMRIGRRT